MSLFSAKKLVANDQPSPSMHFDSRERLVEKYLLVQARRLKDDYMRFTSTPILFLFLIGSFADSAEFITPVGVTSTTDASDLWPASNLIQGPGVGFDAAAPYDKTSSGSEGNWVTADDAGFPSDYIEEVGKPILTFDLGSDQTIGEISVWGYADSNTNGVSEFSLTFATEAEGAAGGTVTAGPFVLAGDRMLGTNDGTSRQPFAFPEVSARYVLFETIDNFFVAPGDGSVPGTLAGGDRVGLGEISFSVPEPSSALLLFVGMLGLARRRR